ncbi:Hypothetical predicted protein [Mytilus galloprovincialis]|uniref:Uncharacterized protein n=1 Tax=Mytilus galloprovincialis TaxID=29158 RepID=A0A8B6CDW5_MYTGA|nr:Hypothetical predicted protein [Mytilus galloprovincialis]
MVIILGAFFITALTVSNGFQQLIHQQTALQKELFGYEDVMKHLQAGYRVSYYMTSPDCNTSLIQQQFHVPFGDSVDFYFQFSYNGIWATQFTSQKHISQAVIDRNDIAHWNISVTDRSFGHVLESWNFTCFFGNDIGKKEAKLKFYATDIKPIKVVYLEDIKTASETGGHVRYSTSFIDCQGDLKWEALGAEITDFDITKVNNVTVIKTSKKATIKGGMTNFEYIILTSYTTKEFGAYTNFIVTYNTIDQPVQEVYRGNMNCMFQSGGGINYYLGV